MILEAKFNVIHVAKRYVYGLRTFSTLLDPSVDFYDTLNISSSFSPKIDHLHGVSQVYTSLKMFSS